MSIWRYDDERLGHLTRDGIGHLYTTVRGTTQCVFCRTPMVSLLDRMEHLSDDDFQKVFGRPERRHKPSAQERFDFGLRSVPHERIFEDRLRICPVCGWWLRFRESITRGEELEVRTYGGVGALRVLDL